MGVSAIDCWWIQLKANQAFAAGCAAGFLGKLESARWAVPSPTPVSAAIFAQESRWMY